MRKRVVVTGLGVVAPNGTGRRAFAEALKNGSSGIRYIQELADFDFGCRIGGIPDVSQSPFTERLDQYGLNTASDFIRYAVIASLEAWTDAGLEIPGTGAGEVDYTTGCMIGTGIGSSDVFGRRIVPETEHRRIRKLRSTIIEHSMNNGAAAGIGGILGLGNMLSSNSSACSTGTESIIFAAERIMQGNAERMIAGAGDAYSPYGWAGFDAMRVLTRKFNDNPEKGSRPMSVTASGFVPSAGAGIVVLEELEAALKRGAVIYCEIAGFHINSGGQRSGGTMTAPSPEGVVRCIKGAVDHAGKTGDDIDYISGHLSSTMADVLEIQNWCAALNRQQERFPYINSLKSLTGHSIGGSGSIETIAAVIQMNEGFIHASVNSEDLHPEIERLVSRNRIPMQTIGDVSLQTVIKASFGFGDVNSCLVLKNFDRPE